MGRARHYRRGVKQMMTKKETLKELEDVAKKLSYEISYESLKRTAPYIKSGSIRLDDKKMILIDKDLNTNRRIGVILNAIKEEELNGIFIKPYVKEIITRSYS
jgi:signal recognition particle subunit SEC65